MTEPLLESVMLCKSFGGLKVADNVSFQLPIGSVRFMIGPNGAGKSSVLRLLLGFLKPDSGDVRIDGRSLLKLTPDERRHAGLTLAFQAPRVVSELSLEENLMLAAFPARGLLRSLRTRRYPAETRKAVRETVELLAFSSPVSTPAGALSHADRKKLEVGCVAVGDSRFVCLDEPTAGLSRPDARRIAATVQTIRVRAAVLIVVHDMDFIRMIDERVMVLHHGRVVGEGYVDELRNDPLMREIYFGQNSSTKIKEEEDRDPSA